MSNPFELEFWRNNNEGEWRANERNERMKIKTPGGKSASSIFVRKKIFGFFVFISRSLSFVVISFFCCVSLVRVFVHGITMPPLYWFLLSCHALCDLWFKSFSWFFSFVFFLLLFLSFTSCAYVCVQWWIEAKLLVSASHWIWIAHSIHWIHSILYLILIIIIIRKYFSFET